MVEFRKLLVPTDFSASSLLALKQAIELARRFGAEVVVVHVLEPPVYPALAFGAGAAAVPALQDVQQEMRVVVTTQLERLRTENAKAGVALRTLLREGTPFYEIIQAAREEKADLIVIATHGHTGIKHLLLGSTTEKVVRKAPCPVLTIREPGREFVMP